MRAVEVREPGGADVLRVAELPDPVPGPGEAVVRIEATGVNFIEIYQRRGLYPVSLPYVPGTEGAGTVAAVGAGVTAVRAGDRVASASLRGSYAELAAGPADRLVLLPAALDTRTGAALMLQGLTAHYLALSTRPLRPGDHCLVHAAAGGVGLLLCQIAARRGARVIATVSTAEKESLARAAGASDVIRYTETDFAAEVARLTGGRGVDVVYDSVGRDTFAGSLACLVPRGTMVLFGQSSGPVPPLDPQLLNRSGSLYLTRPNLVHYTASAEELAARAADLLAWLEDGSLRVRIGGTFPLAQAGRAHEALEGRRSAGKLLLLPA
jgi:NADPH:quinone reductase